MAGFTYNKVKILLLGLAAIVCVFCVSILRSPIPASAMENFDFSDDGTVEKILLGDGKLQVLHSERVGNVLFESESGYEANDFDVGDINNDGEIELVIGFWRFGDFGKELDYQQARRDPKKSYHIYLYKYSEKNDNFYLIWGSSTLPHPIFNFEIIEKDGQNILKVDEGTYEDYDNDGEIKSVKTSYWIWNEWWFEEFDENLASQ